MMYEQEKSEIRILKTYLLTQIPTTPIPPNNILLSSNSVALKAAIAGLDKELSRLEREERLVKKFTAENHGASASNKSSAVGDTNFEDEDMEYVHATKSTDDIVAMNDDDDKKDEEEWEEANVESPSKKQHVHTTSKCDNEKPTEEDVQKMEICQAQASATVARIANDNAQVSTPLGALGIALHTALVQLKTDARSNNQNNGNEPIFKCTGVPDGNITSQFLGVSGKSGGEGGGFAPPIRELPRDQLVPSKWEDKSTGEGVIAFRYKCGNEVYSTESGPTNDATTVYLGLHSLKEGGEEVVTVTFGTLPKDKSATTTTGRKQLKFPLRQHVNLDGFTTAKAKNNGRGVSPSLFYVSLLELLFKFSATFDGVLIPATPEAAAAVHNEEASTSMEMSMERTSDIMPPSVIKPSATDGFAPARPSIPPDGVAVDTTTTDPLRVPTRGRHGDFEGDLLPGGPQPDGLHGPGSGGSQVGPNHPMFDRSFGEDNYYGYDDEFGGGFSSGPPNFGIPGVGGGGMGMRPRFDPYGPPGGPTEPGRGGRSPGRGSRLGRGRGRGRRGGRGRMPPGGFGGPNPDHMQPPGGGYFS